MSGPKINDVTWRKHCPLFHFCGSKREIENIFWHESAGVDSTIVRVGRASEGGPPINNARTARTHTSNKQAVDAQVVACLLVLHSRIDARSLLILLPACCSLPKLPLFFVYKRIELVGYGDCACPCSFVSKSEIRIL